MRYVLVKEGESIRKIEGAEFSEERMLQEMIEKHPEVLSIPTEGNIVPLVKEYPVNTGSVDLVAFDEDGRIYLIETKLHRNYDKRKALAQLIEYASQIAVHDTFEKFKEKVFNRTGKTLEEIVKDRFGERYEEVLDNLRDGFNREKFTLVLVMDELDDPLKDMIIFLNRHLDMNIDVIGVEIRRFVINKKIEIFVPTVVPTTETPPPTPEEKCNPINFVKKYSKAGLRDVAEEVVKTFENAVDRFDNVELYPTSRYLNLRIYPNKGRIDISIKCDPNGDHGVWVHNRDLYETVEQIGRNLGLETKIPSSESGKVISFNGIEGLKSVVGKLDVLIEELVNLRAENAENL